MQKPKLIRLTTVPLSLDKLLSGQLRFMSAFFEVTAVSAEKEYLEKVGEKEGVNTFHLEMTRKITPLKDIMAVIKLVKYLKKAKPKIVHTHTPKAGIVGMLAAKLARVPFRLHTVAGLPLVETKGVKRKVLDQVEKVTYRCATKVYPNSKGLADIIIQNNYCPKEKLKVIAQGSSNGIDTSFFNPEKMDKNELAEIKNKLKIKESDFVFIFVGRLVADKGINELVVAFEQINSKYNNTKLLLVGPFENDLDPLQSKTIQRIKTNANIINTGFQNDIRPYLAIANLLVFPSYREGFPNVVMQAGAMGLPCIVSDINGCNEIIIEGDNGTIIPVKNTQAIIEKMEKCYTDSEYYEKLKANARTKIVERYEQKVVWEAILEEYNRNLNN
ncbi:glycosyltransferase family 4 protein [Flavobacterium capsici]|uniref:Glycosyltransferase family 4 protein n=1 Tax=Flavobacterium capsici TaxID=3075618 RepID=A0AA96EZZ9_9FLAO|nr:MULTISPECIES: glycosyltransferase family 4 protein [unclassified Flavobacterium]WNM20234.1 glycosyltransferase family 4 protein [Flavobacterium sp. PMR2A8]WNM21624.1 glycosyltransferase family 4 protein [Flavobacterium sp. PMTSA4]